MNSLYTAEGVMDKHSLWQRYVPLVRHEALRLQVRLPASVELDDLLQAGGIGLLNAVERYDALQGTAFTTYAVQRIRGAMLDELRSRDWVPRSVRRNAREVAQAIGQLEQELGRNATETEVAERLGIDIADYRQMLLDTITASSSPTMSGAKSTAIASNWLLMIISEKTRYNNCWTVICASG